MKKQKCQHKPSKWELGFYGMCGQCFIEVNQKENKPLQGQWTRSTKAELQAHAKDVLQPLTENGRINKHFIEAHGTKVLEKEMKISKQEIMAQAE